MNKDVIIDHISLGFDMGKTTGWGVTRDGDLLACGKIDSSKMNKLEFMEKIQEIYKKYQPELVAIEEPFIYPKRLNAVIPLAKCAELITLSVLLVYPEALIIEISNKTVKKQITGNGNCKKEDVFKLIRKEYKLYDLVFDKDADITDAIAISLVGKMILDGKIK